MRITEENSKKSPEFNFTSKKNCADTWNA